jgi:hypothetical protein
MNRGRLEVHLVEVWIFLNLLFKFDSRIAEINTIIQIVLHGITKHTLQYVYMHLRIEGDGCLRAARAPATSPVCTITCSWSP